MSNDPDRLAALIDHHLGHEIDRGTVIRNLGAWKAATRKQILEDEAAFPGYIERSLNGIEARKAGKRITQCKEVRGTHAMTYIWAADGTDEPPAWWNRDAAKADEERRRTA